MGQNRRMFLRALGVGVAAVSLPEISPVFNWLGFPGDRGDGVEATIRKLLLGQDTGGPFAAYADTVVEGAPQQLLDAPSALLKILDNLGVERAFSNCVNYDDAAQCGPNFKQREEEWRGQRHGFGDFTDVNRAPADKDLAVLCGGEVRNRNLVRAAGATQYREAPAIALVKDDPGAVLSAKRLLDEKYRLSGKELAQGVAVTQKRSLPTDDGHTATRYETPISSSLYIPRARNNSPISRAVGVVAVQYKRAPDKIYFADLYA